MGGCEDWELRVGAWCGWWTMLTTLASTQCALLKVENLSPGDEMGG